MRKEIKKFNTRAQRRGDAEVFFKIYSFSSWLSFFAAALFFACPLKDLKKIVAIKTIRGRKSEIRNWKIGIRKEERGKSYKLKGNASRKGAKAQRVSWALRVKEK